MNSQGAQKIPISHGYGVFVEQVADPQVEAPMRVVWEIAQAHIDYFSAGDAVYGRIIDNVWERFSVIAIFTVEIQLSIKAG